MQTFLWRHTIDISKLCKYPRNSIQPQGGNMSANIQDRLVRFKGVAQMIPFSRSTINRWEKEGKFPKRVQLGSQAVAWRHSDLLIFMSTL